MRNTQKIKFLMSFKSFRYEMVSAWFTRKSGQALVGLILRLVPTMSGSVTPGLVKGLKDLLAKLSRIAKFSGSKGLVLYLKACSVSIQQSIGGYVTPIGFVSRTRKGLPRILPANYRRLITLGNKFYIRLSLTICSLYRDIIYPSKVKIDSITKPFHGDPQMVAKVNNFIPTFVKVFVGGSQRDLLLGKFSYFPISKASPQSHKEISTNPWALIRSAAVLTVQQIEDLRVLAALSTVIPKSKKPGLLNIKSVHKTDVFARIKLARFLSEHLPKSMKPVNNFSGKLGLKQEAAGKMRVFAMVDPWTQLVLAPLHKALFSILGKHPAVDGTFNQLGPLRRAWSQSSLTRKPLYSMDLSSATDRLPISIQKPLIGKIFNLSDEEADAWVRLLVDRDYMVPKSANLSVKSVRYTVGQPMGALSS
jgi:hypothetical protein